METLDHLRLVKKVSPLVSEIPESTRNQILKDLSLKIKESTDLIIQENLKDLELFPKDDPKYDRLLLNKDRIISIANDIESIASLPTSLNTILEEKVRPNGLILRKISVPLGVVAVIYESRPNVTIDVFSLCFKAGNACVLKGGKEAHYSNTILVSLIKEILTLHKINPYTIYLMPTGRESSEVLLNATGLIDLCIPRGSQSLINFVRENAKIPVIETGAGIVHTYFHQSADLDKGKLIIENAKTRRVSVCNALDSLIIDKERLDDIIELTKPLALKHVEIFADIESYTKLKGSYPENLLKVATPKNFGQEFLSLKICIKTVNSLDEAIAHIRQYSSHHSEAIIAEDPIAISTFLNKIDAAVVYVNTSTAFTDGNEFGMGSEIGISTQKLHVRGPMSLDALTTYKWLVYGDGHIRKS